jgi:hypothetical protein
MEIEGIRMVVKGLAVVWNGGRFAQLDMPFNKGAHDVMINDVCVWSEGGPVHKSEYEWDVISCHHTVSSQLTGVLGR